MDENGQMLALGHAIPRDSVPCWIGSGSIHIVLYDLLVTPAAMETIERVRAGMGVIFRVWIAVRLSSASDHGVHFEEIVCRASHSDWLDALRESGYRRSLLVEIAVPAPVTGDETHATFHLEKARIHLLRGHYTEAVAACHSALEEWSQRRGEIAAIDEARRAIAKDLTLGQRELLLRDAASAYASWAHHAPEAQTTQPSIATPQP